MLNRNMWRLVGAVSVAVSVVAACGDDGAGASREGADVQGVVWVLDELDGEVIAEGVEVTLEYDGERISGSGGCNQYNSDATFDDGTVTVAPEIVSTMMACVGPEAEVEQAYLAALLRVSGFSVEDDTLTITSDGDNSLLVFHAG